MILHRRFIVALLSLCCCALPTSLRAATFIVDTTDDTVDANPGDGSAEDANDETSLRAAIMESNALGGSNEIIVPKGFYALTLVGASEDAGATGDLDITSDVLITGADGLQTIISGIGDDRIFHILSSVDADFEDLIIMGGNVTGEDGGGVRNEGNASFTRAIITENEAENGGGIANQGELNLNDCIVSANVALDIFGGGVINTGTATIDDSVLEANEAFKGGGLAKVDGTVTLQNTTISDNLAFEFGGGIYSEENSETVTLIDCIVTGNEAIERGGGIYNLDDLLEVFSTLIADNEAGYGGGIMNQNGTVDIMDSDLWRNRSSSSGGAIQNHEGTLTILDSTLSENVAEMDGGAIDNTVDGPTSNSSVTIENSTLADNQSIENGGAIHNAFGQLTITESTLQGNLANVDGGGIMNTAGIGESLLLIERSTLSENTALNTGGGIYNEAGLDDFGSGVEDRGNATVSNSTFLDNTAGSFGGAVYNALTGDLSVENSTIVGNSANDEESGSGFGGGIVNLKDDGVILSHTIVTDNFDSIDEEAFPSDLLSIVTDGPEVPISVGNFDFNSDYNLIGVNSGFTGFSDGDGNNNQVGTVESPLDPVLSPPVINHAGTQSLLPLSGSPAIDAGDPAHPTGGTDQGGFNRIISSAIDIGAIELEAVIGDYVWFDTNGDGFQDPGEEGVAGIPIRIDLGENLFSSTFSGENGFYAFNAASGVFTLEFFLRDGLAFTASPPTNDDINSDTIPNIESALIGEITGVVASRGGFNQDEDSGIVRSNSAAPTDPIEVTTFDDNGDFDDGLISLREAVELANLIPGPNTIQLPDDDTPHVLQLGPLEVSTNGGALTIEAVGSSATIDADGGEHILVNRGSDTILNDLLLTGVDGNSTEEGGALFNTDGGQLSLYRCDLQHNATRGGGGAIFNENGMVNVYDSTFTNNSTEDEGGAIANFDILNVFDSDFSNNLAEFAGGAIFNEEGTATIDNCDFSRNSVEEGGGGAISSYEGELVINESDFIDNFATDSGGAIVLTRASLNMTNSTLSNNASLDYNGGALSSNESDAFIDGSFFLENSANMAGGAIDSLNGSLEISYTEISFNVSRGEFDYGEGSVSGGGGGIFSDGTTVILDTCVLGANHSRTEGGGISGQNGSLTIGNSQFYNNANADDNGGAIANFNQSLHINDSNFDDNFSDFNGGAIYHLSGAFQIDNSVFTTNVARNHGGAVYSESADVTVQGSGFTQNIASGESGGSDGGAIYHSGGDLSVFDSDFLSNGSAQDGGAINNTMGALTLENSTFTDNYCQVFGGAVYQDLDDFHAFQTTFSDNISADDGGAVYTKDASGTITECSFTNNSALESNGGALHIDQGSFTLESSTFEDNSAEDYGGAIYFIVDTGIGFEELLLEDCTLTGNETIDGEGGAIYNSSGILNIWTSDLLHNFSFFDGGAIYNTGGPLTIMHSNLRFNRTADDGGAIATGGPSNDLLIVGSELTDNSAGEDGGAIFNDGAMIILDSILDNNTADEDGGAVLNDGSDIVEFDNCIFRYNRAFVAGGVVSDDGTGDVSYTDCLFADNTAEIGGALDNFGDNLVLIENSTLAGNTATNDGGGLHIVKGLVEFVNSTLSDNTATNGSGGAIFRSESSQDNNTGLVALDHSTVYLNQAGDLGGGISIEGTAQAEPTTIFLSHSIIAGNFSFSSNEDDLSLRGTIAEAMYNLIGNPSGHIFFGADAATNLTGTAESPLDPLLGSLEDNGGFTPTHVPIFGSPAVDAGDAAIASLPFNDQRGFNRLTGVIDIGAVEAPTTADTGGPYSVDEDLSLTLNGSGVPRESGGVLSFAWDLDNDGQYDDATGTSPVFTWDELTVGIFNFEDDDYTIGLQVTDVGTVTIIATATTTLSINFFDLEVWRRRFFTTAELDDSKLEDDVWGDLANPDNDSLSNLLEFFMARDPLVKDDDGLPEINASDTELTFLYRRALDTDFYIGIVEWSTDLVTWSNAGVVVEEVVEGSTVDAYDTFLATITLTGQTEMFVRLRLVVD